MKQQEQNNRESLYEADHKTNREQQFRVHSSTVGWQNSKQENRNRNKPLVSSSKKAKQKCSISFFFIPFFARLSRMCLHACVIKGVVKQQQGFYFPPMHFTSCVCSFHSHPLWRSYLPHPPLRSLLPSSCLALTLAASRILV